MLPFFVLINYYLGSELLPLSELTISSSSALSSFRLHLRESQDFLYLLWESRHDSAAARLIWLLPLNKTSAQWSYRQLPIHGPRNVRIAKTDSRGRYLKSRHGMYLNVWLVAWNTGDPYLRQHEKSKLLQRHAGASQVDKKLQA